MNLGLLGGLNARNERERERERKRGRKEELGELALARLRGLGKEKEAKSAEREEKVIGTVMLERAAVKDLKDWEVEDSECADEKNKESAVEKGARASLLD